MVCDKVDKEERSDGTHLQQPYIVTKTSLETSYLIKRTLKKRKNCYLPYGNEDNINKIVIFNGSEIAI